MALHEDGAVLHAGKPLAEARRAMIMLHGRGATARDILSLAPLFGAADIAYLAPQAANNTWYPYSFMTPMERNEPWLSSALARADQMVERIGAAGIDPASTHILGFSQGACLALEYVARHARRYAGVIGLSGGLIGPDGTPRDYAGSLAGVPIFLGCSDVDMHIPKERVIDTGAVFERLAAHVTLRLYPNLAHTVNEDEIQFIRELLTAGPQPA